MEFSPDSNPIVVMGSAISALLLGLILLHHRKERKMHSSERLETIYEQMKHGQNPVKREINSAMQGQSNFEKITADDFREYLNYFKNMWLGCERGWYSINEIRNVFEHEIESIREFNLIAKYNKRSPKDKQKLFDEVVNLCNEIVDDKRARNLKRIVRFIRRNVG